MKSAKGFTLIELIVVIAVLSILMFGIILVINPLGQFQKARDAQRKSDLRQVQHIIEQYYNDNGSYPVISQFGGNTCLSFSNWGCWSDPSSVSFIFGQNNTSYIKKLPTDPRSNDTGNCSELNAYGYYSPDGTIYYLFTKLENLSDPDVQNGASHSVYDSDGSQILNAAGSTCGGWANYLLTNK